MLKAWNPVSHKVCQVGVLGWTRTAVHSRPRIFAVHKLLLKSIRRAVVWLSVYLLFSEEKLAFLCVCLFGSSYLQWGGVRHPTHRRPRWWRNREVGRWAREIKRSNRPTCIERQQWWSLLRQSVYGCCLFFPSRTSLLWWWRICILCFAKRKQCMQCLGTDWMVYQRRKPPCLPSRLPFL